MEMNMKLSNNMLISNKMLYLIRCKDTRMNIIKRKK